MQLYTHTTAQQRIVLGFLLCLIFVIVLMSVLMHRPASTTQSAPAVDEPPHVTVGARYRGTLSSPNDTCTLHIYTYDQGALGRAWQWVYQETSDSQLQLIVEGCIASDQEWCNITWISDSAIELMQMDRDGRTLRRVIAIDVNPS
jgi:hypothetical protein